MIGPIVSGELRPAREATVRAELGGSMTAVLVEEGQRTTQGAVIGRIETRTLDDVRQSAASAVRSAESQLALAQREVARTEQLVQGRRAGRAGPRSGARQRSHRRGAGGRREVAPGRRPSDSSATP